MSDALKLQISAFVDGELPAEEAELLTRRLSHDATLRHQAAEYLAIGRLLRGETSLPGMADLRTRISAAIDHEEQPAAAAPAPGGTRWLRPVSGVAVAASVAVLALVGLRQVEVPDAGGVAAIETAPVAAGQPAGYTEPLVTELTSDRPSERLMQYYLSHGATNGDLGANGILSRLVTLELRGGELVEVAPAEVPGAGLQPDAAAADDDRAKAAQDE